MTASFRLSQQQHDGSVALLLFALVVLLPVMTSSTMITDDNFRGLIRDCLADLPHTNVHACNTMATWDVSRVTDCSLLFWEELPDASAWKLSAGADFFNVDISTWDTRSCTSMHGMFHGASAFNQPIGQWDVANVTDMARLFQGAKQFRQELVQWDTAKVTDMSHMFRYAETFAPAEPLAWNVAQVRSFEYMFHDALEFNNAAIAKWHVTGAREEETVDDDLVSINDRQWAFKSMFDGAIAFNIDISDWDITSAKSLALMFHVSSELLYMSYICGILVVYHLTQGNCGSILAPIRTIRKYTHQPQIHHVITFIHSFIHSERAFLRSRFVPVEY
jgi:surface protein